MGIGGSLAINEASKNKDAAAAYLNWYYGDKAAALKRMADVPSTYNIPVDFTDAEIPQGIDPRSARVLTSLNKAVETGDYGYVTWTWWPPKTDVFVYEGLEQVLTNKITPAEYCKQLDEKFTAEKAEGTIPQLLERGPARERHRRTRRPVRARCGPGPAARGGDRLGVPRSAAGPQRAGRARPVHRHRVLLVHRLVRAGAGDVHRARQLHQGVRRPKVHEALLHNGIWFVLFLSVPMALGLLGAHVLSQVRRFQVVFRALYFIPYVVASVVNAAVWKMLLSPTSGIGHALGFDHSWLGDPATSLLSVNFVVDWHWWGFLAVIFFAAMQGVDPQLYDAAKVDGASTWQQFKAVTLPGIRPTAVFLVLMTVIWTLKAFDYIFIMTGGGPAGSSEVVSTLMYKQAFNEYEAGYAAALGLSMTVVTAVILAVYQYLRQKGWED